MQKSLDFAFKHARKENPKMLLPDEQLVLSKSNRIETLYAAQTRRRQPLNCVSLPGCKHFLCRAHPRADEVLFS